MACSREVSQMLESVEYDRIGPTGSVGGWPGWKRGSLLYDESNKKKTTKIV